jgi:hypothetical protein
MDSSTDCFLTQERSARESGFPSSGYAGVFVEAKAVNQRGGPPLVLSQTGTAESLTDIGPGMLEGLDHLR